MRKVYHVDYEIARRTPRAPRGISPKQLLLARRFWLPLMRHAVRRLVWRRQDRDRAFSIVCVRGRVRNSVVIRGDLDVEFSVERGSDSIGIHQKKGLVVFLITKRYALERTGAGDVEFRNENFLVITGRAHLYVVISILNSRGWRRGRRWTHRDPVDGAGHVDDRLRVGVEAGLDDFVFRLVAAHP